jgi:hypothetical protein
MFNPPVILQATETEFQAAIRDEFINKSCISPDLFETIAEFTTDQEIENGEIVGEPIAEFRNWEVKTSQAGFSNRQTEFALLLRNEDGTAWQDKSNLCRWNKEKQKYGKPYTAPKRSEDEFPPAYLPPIGKNTRKALGHSLDGSYWDSVEADPTIAIVIGEGAKKSLCALSHGIPTIALYGCDAGSKKVDGEHVLIPDLARFCQPGRTFILAFDKDSNPQTVERVNRAIGRLSWLLSKQAKNITVKVAQWNASQGKGLDDLVVNCGPQALRKTIAEAQSPKVAAFVRPNITNRLANRVKRTPDRNIGNLEFKAIAHELPTSGIVVLVGAKGTTKSEAIAIIKRDRSWLSITHRRSIGRDQAAGWNGVFLQDGDRVGSQALKPDGSPASGASVCFPSVLAAEMLSREVAIFDETTAGLEFLLSSKLCNKSGIRPLLIEEMERTIRDASQVILADADMTEETIAYIEAIRGERAYVVQSERKPLGYVVHNMTGKKNQAIAEFLRQAKEIPAGKFIYFNSDNKNLVNALEIALTAIGIKALTFTQDNSGETLQRSLIEGKGRNLHEFAMMGIKVFLSSPSITQGFSLIHNTDRIISRWGIYTGRSISAQDIAQSPDRIRSDVPLYLSIAERGSAYSRLGKATNQKQFLKDFESVSTTSARLVRHSLSATAAAAVDAMDYQNRNLLMLASIEVSRNLGMVALRETVLSHLRLEGKRIQDYAPAIDVAAAKLAGQTIAAAGMKLKADHAAAVERAADLTEDEAKILEKKAEKQALTLEERLSVEKHYLGIFYRLEKVKAVDVILDCDGRTRQQVRNLERVLDGSKAIAHTAESIDRNASTPQDWSKAAVRSWILEASGAGDLIRKFSSGEITQITPELVEPIYQFVQDHSTHFKKGFGWGGAKNLSPMKTIGVMLDWVGIGRKSHRHRSEGTITRVYSIDSDRLEWLKMLIERRSQPDPHVDILDTKETCGSPQNPPIDLTEWGDFVELERQKHHSPDSLRSMMAKMAYVPAQVWEAIAA